MTRFATVLCICLAASSGIAQEAKEAEKKAQKLKRLEQIANKCKSCFKSSDPLKGAKTFSSAFRRLLLPGKAGVRGLCSR